ncbi:L-rhamnose mutarotase [Acidobacteriota bacterium]
MKRYGQIIKVKPEKLAEYKKLHQAVWPEVLSKIKECHIRNYTIFYRDGCLYSYFEYIGSDYEYDMRRMAEDSITQEWWKLTDPCQQPIETAVKGERWSPMQEVFHCD